MWKMNPWLCFAALLVLAAGCRPSAPTLEGTWTGFAYSPGGEIVDLTYNVTPVADSFHVVIEMPQGQIPAEAFRLADGGLTFTMYPGFKIDCRLVEEDGLYKGGCTDGAQNVAPMVLAPPGREVVADDMDSDKAFEVWGISRVEYEWERYGRRQAEKANLEALVDAEPTGRQVEVAGTSYHLVEQGAGDVTLVLEAGLGDDHTMWRTLRDTLATLTRVVTYDRAGLGQSGASAAPRTPAQIADELHALLQHAGVPPPYVLVGHEVGGLYVRAFAARHPEAVGGLVLIDPAHEHLGARWNDLDAAAWADYLQKRQAFTQMLPGAIGAEFEAYAAVMQSSQFPEAAALPEVPTVVITGARPAENPKWIGETPEGVRAKKEVHAAWTNQLPLGTHRVTENAGSYVHHEDPEVVLQAVQHVLNAVRDR